MTKSERLLFIISYLQNRGRSTVEELASECGVSHRTIYRDVNSLSLLNIPIIQNNGYRLISKSRISASNMNDSDVELLCYALRSNKLSNHAFFRRRFRVIENLIHDNVRSVRSRQTPRLFYWPQDKGKIEEAADDKLIENFIKAIKRYRLIEIFMRGQAAKKTIRAVPLAIKIENNSTKFIFMKSGNQKPSTEWTSAISKVKELPGAFDPQELSKFRQSEFED